MHPFRVVAPNPGAMTLDGTNTWILENPGAKAVVIDAGPLDAAHQRAVAEACPEGIAEIWITHTHDDHIGGAAALAAPYGAPVRCFDPSAGTGEPFRSGEQLVVGEAMVTVIHLPGHTSDSIGFLLEGVGDAGPVLFTGDTMLGRGSTVITHPDGDLGDYLTSMDRMIEAVSQDGVRRLLPGHGPIIEEPADRLVQHKAHRLRRLAQVREAVEVAGCRGPEEVAEHVYRAELEAASPSGDVNPVLWRAALASTRSQLDYLSR